MLQEIFPKKYHPEFRNQKPSGKDFLLHFEYNKIMLMKDPLSGEFSLPRFSDLEEEEEDIYENAYYVCAIDKEAFFLVDALRVPDYGIFHMEGIQSLRSFSPGYQAFGAITASQVYRWIQSRKYCGHCGKRMKKSQEERALVCPSCKSIEYPKIAPAVIVAIIHGDKILLAKSAHGPYKNYALVAGFVEVGETLADTVHREVMEEVGLKVKNIRFYKSQPWSLSDAMMLAFIAELDGEDTITLQREELSEAKWFNREDVPVLPFHISVGHELMYKFKTGEI